jgi:hypothetical protein
MSDSTGEKLLVISDTHGCLAALASVLNWARHVAPEAAVFLGDGIEDLQRAPSLSCAWHKVRGNGDWGTAAQDMAVFDFGGHRFFICHGHRHDVYGGKQLLAAAAANNGADAALFGHTHVPFNREVGGITLVNPGSVGRPRSNAGATFALIECAPEKPLDVGFWVIETAGAIRPLR